MGTHWAITTWAFAMMTIGVQANTTLLLISMLMAGRRAILLIGGMVTGCTISLSRTSGLQALVSQFCDDDRGKIHEQELLIARRGVGATIGLHWSTYFSASHHIDTVGLCTYINQ